MEENIVHSLLEKHKNAGSSDAKRILSKSLLGLKTLKKIAKCQAAKSSENRIDGYVRGWLWDNYSSLRERQLDNYKVLRYNSKAVLEKIGIILLAFEEYTEKTAVTKEKIDVEKWISAVNNNTVFEAGLEISPLILCCMKLVVYMRITGCFEEYFEKDAQAQTSLSKIEKLFSDAVNLYEFDKAKVYESNPAEKVLLEDKTYSLQTEKTKAFYRKMAVKFSRKMGLPQKKYLQMLISKCKHGKGKKSHIGFYLLDNRRVYGNMYLFLLFLLTILLWLPLVLYSGIFILSLPIVYRCFKILLDRVFSYVKTDFCLPSLKLEKIPDGEGIMVVVTTLLTGDIREDELFERLERFYLSNGGENVYFAILCDLADSDSPNDENDREILLNAGEKIRQLNKQYGGFFLFVRERQYSDGEKKFIAPERKRGAVVGLCEFLCAKSDVFCDGSIKPDESICNNVRYVLTLDADTNLSPDCLKILAGTMLHPLNAPVIDKEKGVVTGGYGIIQPVMATGLENSLKTSFTRVHCFERGIDSYSFAYYDGLMRLFGKGVFCGKGMFDKWAFYNTLCRDKEFEKERVLSHDAPEGARLRCAVIPEVCFTDSFPTCELSYFKRLHRWVRGDVQNLVFLKRSVKNSRGEQRKNGIDLISKIYIAENLVNAVLPVVSTCIVLISLVLPEKANFLMLVAVLPYCLGWILELLFSLYTLSFHNFTALFYSRGVYTPFFHSFMGMLYSLCAMVKSAYISADAIIRSGYRMIISHKKRLEWTTAAQNDREKKDGLLGYVKKNLLSAFLGAVLFVFSPPGFAKILGLMWFFYPYIAYVTAVEKKKKKNELPYEDKLKLFRYAEDMWKYFDEAVCEETGFIPCDNISLYHERKSAVMTSPTNIGLYILCAVCMICVFGKDEDEILEGLEKTVEAVEKLPKYKGLLYNWYDVKKGTPMKQEYISSVDLGNYKACLISSANMLIGFNNPLAKKLSERLVELSRQTDTSVLYNKEKNLFYIGAAICDGKLVYDKNCYDMLMSEARILSYIAIAERSVPFEHASSLSRPMVKGKRYIGLASWSGTAFEYFLPQIFLPLKEGSLIYEAVRFAFDEQKKAYCSSDGIKMFGISESCYNETDMSANYKYFAFGVEECALKPVKTAGVISPYSSFLMLEQNPKKVLKNLENMEKAGLYGEYGFYESADFERPDKTEDFGKVKCFMSHHLGMSICAVANAVSDGIIRKSFMADKNNNSVKVLLEERIPGYITVKTKGGERFTPDSFKEGVFKSTESIKSRVCRLSGDKMSLFADNRGNICMRYDGLYVNKISLYGPENGLFRVYVKIDDEIFMVSKTSYVEKRPGQVVLSKEINTAKHGKFQSALSFTLDKNTSFLIRAHLRIRRLSGTSEITPKCMFVFLPVLDTKDKMKIPSFFCRNELCAAKDEDGSMMNYKNQANGLCMSVSLGNKKEMYFHTDKSEIKKCFDENNIQKLFENEEDNTKAYGNCCCVCGCLEYSDTAYRNELFVSVSENEKCASMGIVRGIEKSFIQASESFFFENDRFTVKEKAVKGAYAAKKVDGVEICTTMPKVVFGENCAFFPNEKSLGYTVAQSRNSYLSAAFENVFENKCAESIILGNDSFDGCKNASETVVLPHAVIYKGEYMNKPYSITAFTHSHLSEKLIEVKMPSDISVKMRVYFDKTPTERFEIAAGALCLKRKDAVSYLFGCDGKRIARPVPTKPGEIILDGIKNGDSTKALFVFGKADSFEKVSERTKNAFCDYEKQFEKSREYVENRKIDFSQMNDDEKNAMIKLAPYVSCGYAVKPLFSDSFEEKMNYMLCLTYTIRNVPLKDVIALGKYVDFQRNDILCLVYCLTFARCIYNENQADLNWNGISEIYRKVLGCAFESAEKYKSDSSEGKGVERQLLKAVLHRLELAANKISDTRAAIALSDEARFIK